MNNSICCLTCRYRHREAEGRISECRRFPPIIIVKIQNDDNGMYTTHHAKFPFVQDDTWCGEYRS